MKTFTAKQFSRAPAQVFDAAREDGQVEITHDRFIGKFEFTYVKPIEENDAISKELNSALDKFVKQRADEITEGIGKVLRKEKGPEGPDSEQ